jgi:hypothetical protein
MIPVALIAEAIPMLMGAARLIRGLLPDEEQKLLVKWADLLKEASQARTRNTPMPDAWKTEVRQFLSDLTLRRKFSPAYQYEQSVAVPVDLLTDIVDLLVGGWSSGSTWSLKNLMGRDPEKERMFWSETIASATEDVILQGLEVLVAKRGRTRAYSPTPAINCDVDWVADVGMYLIG